MNGPNGSRQMTKLAQVPGSYSGLFSSTGQPAYLVPGNYTLSGTGGADVGAFTANIVGSPISWTNSSITSVNRSQDLLITWSGGAANGLVEITGTSTQITIQGTTSIAVGATFICFAQSSAGQFSVPSAVLLSLPPSSQQVGGSLFVGGESFNPITVPGVDYATAGYLDMSGKSVSYQ